MFLIAFILHVWTALIVYVGDVLLHEWWGAGMVISLEPGVYPMCVSVIIYNLVCIQR